MPNRATGRMQRLAKRQQITKWQTGRGRFLSASLLVALLLTLVFGVWKVSASANPNVRTVSSIQSAPILADDVPTISQPSLVPPANHILPSSKPKQETYLELDLSQGKGLFTEWRIVPSNCIALTNTNHFKRACDLHRGDVIHMSQNLLGLVTKVRKYVGPQSDSDNKLDASGNVAERVIGWSKHVADTLLYLHTADEVITTTPEHPFFVHGKGWIKAENLQSGELIETESFGKNIAVLSTEIVHKQQAVYNLDVENTHTFYVGKDQLLVHNGSCVPTPDFVVSPNGTAVEIPEGYVGRVADNGQGLVYQDPADIGVGNGNQNMVRIADPNARYPNGYARFYNGYGQPIDEFGNPGNQATTHFPF